MATLEGLVWREPTPADADALGRMHHQAWVEAYSDLLPADWFEHWTVDAVVARWRRTLGAPAPEGLTRLVVVDEHGSVVAWVASGPSRRGDEVPPARPLELWGLYVAGAYHGSGLARQLAERALGDAPAELWVFDGNPRAEAFYRKLGFARDGVEATHHETGLHGIRMVRGR